MVYSLSRKSVRVADCAFSKLIAQCLSASSQNHPSSKSLSAVDGCTCTVPAGRAHRRSLTALPNVLTIDTNIRSATDTAHWTQMYDRYDKTGTTIGGTPQTRQQKSTQPCRFGTRCNRADCAYVHEGR